jgi:hypothetical protein
MLHARIRARLREFSRTIGPTPQFYPVVFYKDVVPESLQPVTDILSHSVDDAVNGSIRVRAKFLKLSTSKHLRIGMLIRWWFDC